MKNINVYSYLSQQRNTCSKSATETLEVTEDKPNESIFTKSSHRRWFYKKMFLNISQISQENTCAKASYLRKLPEACNFIKKETLAQVFSCEFCEIFKNTFFTERLQVTDSDIRMQVVVIYNLNLSSRFVAINFTFSLLSFHAGACFNVA